MYGLDIIHKGPALVHGPQVGYGLNGLWLQQRHTQRCVVYVDNGKTLVFTLKTCPELSVLSHHWTKQVSKAMVGTMNTLLGAVQDGFL